MYDKGGPVVVLGCVICVNDLVICSDRVSKSFRFRNVVRSTFDLCSALRSVCFTQFADVAIRILGKVSVYVVFVVG